MVIISVMPAAMMARKNVRESPTEIGICGSRGATPPASKRMMSLGELVFWDSMAAAQGAPVPTATVLPSSR